MLSIQHLLYDSRQLTDPITTLFFAIVGQRNDGHQYIESLYQKGVRAFVISDESYKVHEDATYFLVENTVTALQQLVIAHRQQFDYPVIGITGSNGKTIVKEWLYQLLHPDLKIIRSPKSYNSQIGVPLSVWKMDATHELGIFEAGISQVGEMNNLAPIIDCQIGIFTNIGSAHNEGFTNQTQKISEKLQLFENTETLIYCQDYDLIHRAVRSKNIKTFTWSKHQAADLQITSIKTETSQTIISAFFDEHKVQIQIPFTDEASIENAIHCWAYLLLKKYPLDTIQNRMLQLESVEMRLELKKGIHHSVLINDSYNADLESLRIALHFMQQQSNRTSKTVILSDIQQSGLDHDSLYQEVAQQINNNDIQRFIGIGTSISSIKPFLNTPIESHFYKNTDTFLNQINETDFTNQAILIKGARVFQLDKITNRLSRKVHQTVLEVNLSALEHNLQQYTNVLHSKTKVLVMVKADAYGCGSIEVARLLEQKNVDYLGVAYADEGVKLRQAGIQTPILVLNSEQVVFENMIAHDLEPEIYSLLQLKQFIAAVPPNKKYPIHLDVDTGMKRLGFDTEDLDELCEILKLYNDRILVKSIFSHLAASESAEQDAFTEQQIQRFLDNYARIVQVCKHQPDRHILNSSGILRFPQYQMEMVRLGIGLYGSDSSQLIQPQLKSVVRLTATISQIKTIKANETIGYSRKGKLPNGGRIATISIGYADGLLRRAGNGRHQVVVQNQLAPIIGNVCMDMCMIDVSHIPKAKEGDIVEVFGNHVSIEQLAKSMDTISYEIFTNISDRVKRVYFME